MQLFRKTPTAKKPYTFDWSDWLQGDTIQSATISAPDGITATAASIDDNSTSVQTTISGGEVGHDYDITCHILTTQGLEEDAVLTIHVVREY